MNKQNFRTVCCIFIIATTLLITGCGIHYNVKGRVVDATTGEPIEGASVAIRWVGKKIGAIFAPYASGTYTVEKAKDVSDKDGYFRVPKYLLKSSYMGVYKQGYVCWTKKQIFLQGKPRKEEDQFGVRTYRIKNRTGFHLKSGMVIELEPFTATDSQTILQHAQFTDHISTRVGDLPGIEKEVEIVMEDIRKKKAERLNKQKNRKTGAAE